jgi:hypothetical protein
LYKSQCFTEILLGRTNGTVTSMTISITVKGFPSNLIDLLQSKLYLFLDAIPEVLYLGRRIRGAVLQLGLQPTQLKLN